MDVMVERCCGLDVHTDTVVACVRTPGPSGGRDQETRLFGTMMVDLLALRDSDVAGSALAQGVRARGQYKAFERRRRTAADA